MGYIDDQTSFGSNGQLDAVKFLQQAGDSDLLNFLRQLPMIAGNTVGKFTLSDFIFEAKHWPFVKEAWASIPGQPRIAGRLRQIDLIYTLAAENLKKLTGAERRVPRVIDVAEFISIYTTEGLP